MPQPIPYCLQTFGCKSNQYESQAIRESLEALGYEERATPAEARLLIVNTCGVTGRAGASCRNAMRKALRANPGLLILVTGCGVDLGESWPTDPERTALVPNGRKHAIATAAAELLGRSPGPDAGGAAGKEAEQPAGAERNPFALSISSFRNHTRAFIKVQDGCDNFCSYCAVPHARGKPISRPMGEVLEEARRLAARGHRELVLTGINIGAYTWEGRSLAELLLRLADTPGLARLRLGSVEPPHMNASLARAMASHPAICPHIHLPLQSGDDRILSRMGRRYTAREFLDKVDLLREHLPVPAITTDLIVGFPGEDEASVRSGMDLCRRAGFSRLHVFLFSPRPGTPAAGMARVASDREVAAWKDSLIRLGREISERYATACVGLEETVLLEGPGHGLTRRYLTARLPAGIGEKGDVVRVRITGAKGPEALAEASDSAQGGEISGMGLAGDGAESPLR